MFPCSVEAEHLFIWLAGGVYRYENLLNKDRDEERVVQSAYWCVVADFMHALQKHDAFDPGRVFNRNSVRRRASQLNCKMLEETPARPEALRTGLIVSILKGNYGEIGLQDVWDNTKILREGGW